MKIGSYTFTEEEVRKADYVFSSFQAEFPGVEYSYVGNVIGIGEKDRYLMAYFLYESNTVFVKFRGRNSLPLSSDRSSIDALIEDTVKLFKTNSLKLKKQRSSSPPVTQSENSDSNDYLTDTANTYFVTVLANADENVVLPPLCSTRLRNRLIINGINTVKDLKRFSPDRLMKIRNFGVKCLSELCSVLNGADRSENREQSASSEALLWLNSLATCATDLRIHEKNANAISYLTSIGYDEQKFYEGSVGYYLCITKKLGDDDFIFTPDFSDTAAIYKIYTENTEQFDLIYLQLLEYIEMVSNRVLSEREKRILMMRLGLTADVTTLASIGREEGVTRECIRRILLKINRKFHLRRSFKLLPADFYKMNLIKQMKDISIEAFIFYLIFREDFAFLFNFLFKVFFQLPSHTVSVKSVLSYEKALIPAQKFNTKVSELITSFGQKTFISDTEWEQLQPQRHVAEHEDSYSGVFTYQGREYEYESNMELLALQRFLRRNTFKDVKTQSLAIELPNGHKYVPDFECLTHENHLVIVEIKPLLKMCERKNILKFKALKAYCKKYGYGYLIVDSAFRSLETVVTENKDFNEKIISRLPLTGASGLSIYKEIYRETNAKITDLLWLVTHSDVQFSIPFSITLS